VKDSAEESPLPPALAAAVSQEGPGLTPVRSIIAAPMLIDRNFMGLLRIDSGTPSRFQEVDLQQLELYAHLSTLALENARLFDKINSLATKDGLTGLATHRVFQEKLADEIQRAARYRTPLALVMLDIDHFKAVNDTHGHLGGDQVLKEVSRIIADHCRPVDFAARYGGEEFCLILPETGLAQARELAERLRLAVQSRGIALPRQTIAVTVSLGCAAFPDEAQTPPQLIRTADQRLYRAKSSGRNRVVAA
jgi:diguanylate cyclase (GGDEF)-like protein